MIEPLYSLSGFVVGFIVGMTGVGGGSLMTPLLVLLFGVHPATAVGTDLLYAALTKSIGSLVHGLRDNVDWRIVRLLAAGSVPASAIALVILAKVGVASPPVARALATTLGVALILTAASIVFRRRLLRMRSEAAPLPQRSLDLATIAIGAAIGALVSLSSVGAGAIGVTALLLLYPRLPTVRVVGTDVAHAVPLTLVAGLGHWAVGSVDGAMLASLLLGSAPGILLGSLLAPRVDERLLRLALAVVLLVVGSRLLLN